VRRNVFNGAARVRRPLRSAVLLAAASLSACSGVTNLFTGPSPAIPGVEHLSGFIGGVVADEPRAALVAREVLATGGNAADAATALGFALSVTYPSRASLGAGGACLAFNPLHDGPGNGVPEAILFMPRAAAAVAPGADRPAAVPMLARGLFALHDRYGRQPFEPLVLPAQSLAQGGVVMSRAFATDLALVAGPLLADPTARAIFAGPGGRPLGEGDRLLQPALGATLGQLRNSGVGDMYQGVLAHQLADATARAGGAIGLADLRAALPLTAPAILQTDGRDRVAFLPPPADGGLAAAAAFGVLQTRPGDVAAAGARALAVAARWRSRGGDPAAVLAAGNLPAASLPALPASTGFATLDRDGNAVACVVTMNNLFGTGRVAPGTGIVLAASPADVPAPLLAASIAYNPNRVGFRAAVTGTGQDGAALAAAVAMLNTLRSLAPMPAPVPEPGRADVIACPGYLPDNDATCRWAVDPRGAGLAIGAN
jgi:gamma-glutamyltranspeptidase/glutathione hydrolase